MNQIAYTNVMDKQGIMHPKQKLSHLGQKGDNYNTWFVACSVY